MGPFKIVLAVIDIVEDIVLDIVTNKVRIRSVQRETNKRLLANIIEAAWAHN